MSNENDQDQCVAKVLFGISNTVKKATGKTASELLLRYKPGSHAGPLISIEVQEERSMVENLQNVRAEVSNKKASNQVSQMQRFHNNRIVGHKFTNTRFSSY